VEHFDPQQYGPSIAALIDPTRLGQLGPGRPDSARQTQLAALTPETVTAPQPVADRDMALCCMAGLWLAHDFLDQSHTISQGIHTTSGSYWHGIMHRREPDFSNAKYWFRRVGEHPIFDSLAQRAREIASAAGAAGPAAYLIDMSQWDPFAFVDLCQTAQRNESVARICQRVAASEWQLLFDFCYRQSS
jgi:hypothetical protein